MDAELIDGTDSQPLSEKPHGEFQSEPNHQDQELGSRAITWTLTALDGKIDPKAYERLKSEIAWSDIGEDGTMYFKSKDADEMSAFSKKIRAIFSVNEDQNTAEAFSFSITSRPL